MTDYTDRLLERTAQIAAHRACCGTEHDPLQGKLHGYCVVCGVPWPSDYAGEPPSLHLTEDDYQHFLAYSNLEHKEDLRLAYFHGAGDTP